MMALNPRAAEPFELQRLQRLSYRNPRLFTELLVGLATDTTYERIMLSPKYPLTSEANQDKISSVMEYLQTNWKKTPGILAAFHEKARTRVKRKPYGQFFTPYDVARLAVAKLEVGQGQTVLDPGCGSAVFGVALKDLLGDRTSEVVYLGIEADPTLALAAAVSLDFAGAPRAWRVLHANFLRIDKDYLLKMGLDGVDRVVCNPPFVRHHMLEGQSRIIESMERNQKLHLSGFSGLHSLFLAQTIQLLKPESRMVFLLPVGIKEVNYGAELLDQLANRFEISETKLDIDLAMLSFGPRQQKLASQMDTSSNASEGKLGDLAFVRRGLSTGANRFFVLSQEEIERRGIPRGYLRPVIPTKSHIEGNQFTSQDWDQLRKLNRPCWLFVVPDIPPNNLPASVVEYLEVGRENGIQRIPTCKNRKPWYSIELGRRNHRRPKSKPSTGDPPHLFFTYMFRGYPRFIYNKDKFPILTNLLGVYVKSLADGTKDTDEKLIQLSKSLNADVRRAMKKNEGSYVRRYSGGLLKLEPSDIENMPISSASRRLLESFGTHL
jgi:tRNA1(Val) A37 N6-methylase TrmN6